MFPGRRAVLLLILTALNTIAVFAFQWYVVAHLGADSRSDALFASMVVPQLIVNVISGSLAFVLVPMLSTVDERHASSLLWTFVVLLTSAFAILSAILWLLAAWWVPLIVPGFSAPQIDQTVQLVRIQLVGMVFAGSAAPFAAGYQASGRFVYPAFASALASIGAFVFVWLFIDYSGISGAAWGLTFRAVLQFLIQLRIGFPARAPVFSRPEIGAAWARLRPLLAGSVYYKSDQLVDRFLASLAPVGVLSLLHFAQQIYAAAHLALVNAFASPAVPIFAKHAARGATSELRAAVLRTMAIVVGAGVFVFAVIAVSGRQILWLMFSLGKVSVEQIYDLWLIMLTLGVVWFTGLTGQVLSTAFYAMSDTSTPTRIGVVGFTIGIPLKIAGFHWFGVYGIALATGAYMAMNSVAMYVLLLRKLGHVSER